MIYEKLEQIEKMAMQLQALIARLRHENSLLNEKNKQLRADLVSKAIAISELEDQLAAAKLVNEKNNIFNFIKLQDTEGVAKASPQKCDNVGDESSKTKRKTEKAHKTMRKPRSKARPIDLLATQEKHHETAIVEQEVA